MLYRAPQSPWTPDYSNAWGPLVVQRVHAVLPVRGLQGYLCSGHHSRPPRIWLQHPWGLESSVNTCILPVYPRSLLLEVSISSMLGNWSCQFQGHWCCVVKAFFLVPLSSHLAISHLHQGPLWCGDSAWSKGKLKETICVLDVSHISVIGTYLFCKWILIS